MTGIVILLFTLVVVLIAGLLGVIWSAFDIEGVQAQWLEVVGMCAVVLVFVAWRWWRGDWRE
jgi:hypothetical protein